MQITVGGKIFDKRFCKRILYSLCFCLFCIVDQRVRTANGPSGWLETFRDLTGVLMAIIILSHYSFTDFHQRKLPYCIWTIVGICAGISAFVWGVYHQYCLKDWFVILLGIFLFGYILIHTFICIVIEKKLPKLNKVLFVLWVIMMVLMIVSRSSYIWPFCYLVMFGCFYLTDYSKEEREDLFQGVLNGIILGFFVIQGLAFVFRPYDEVRYKGLYANTNVNALFYLEVLAAVLTKIVYVTKENGSRWKRIFYWLGAGVVLSFLLLTIGRTAWLTAFLMVLLFLWVLRKIQMKKYFFRNGIVLVLCVCLTFPLCFGAVRYLPPLFHHPVWFAGEWSEKKVQSWDPWDSEKYVELDEFLEAAVGRLAKSAEDLLRHSPLLLHADAAEESFPLTFEQRQDNIMLRYTIYKLYASNLNLWGHLPEEQRYQVAEDYWAYHAHNIYLQYGSDFGIIVMFLFGVISIGSCVILQKRFVVKKNVQYIGYMLFALIPILYGIFDCSWGTGSLCTLMMFLAWKNVICSYE